MSKIHTNSIFLGSVPALLCFDSDREKAAAKGTVLLFHGFNACKEVHGKELLSLAKRGFLAIGVDNVDHGQRLHPEFQTIYTGKAFEENYQRAVVQTAAEVPAIIDALLDQSLVEDVKLGCVGISMGAYITYRAILEDRRILAAVPLLGCPVWEDQSSPHLFMQDFYPCAILSQTAGMDRNVPPGKAREFHSALVPYYQRTPERIRYIEYRNSAHFMREDDWDTAWSFTLDWLERFL